MTSLKKLSLLLNSGKNEIYLGGFVHTKPNAKAKIKNLTIYWNFKNVNVTLGSKTITFKEGYWTFYNIAKKLNKSGVKLKWNRYDTTCSAYPKNDSLNLKNLGPLLGFSKNKTVNANSWLKSPLKVKVNLGLGYVTAECSLIDIDKNFDHYGKRSKIIATIRRKVIAPQKNYFEKQKKMV